MYSVFKGCTSLTGLIKIDSEPTNHIYYFNGVNFNWFFYFIR